MRFNVAATVPTVTTGTAGSITTSSATISGNNVTSDGGAAITERGVVWATTANPTTSNNKVTVAGTTGSFNASITGLAAGTTYNVRAYAINSAGTSYGSNISFITVPGTPATPTAASVTTTGFTVNWAATTGAASYRLDVSTAANFGTLVSGYNDLTVNSTSQAVTGLSPGTTYYVRIRAVNASGTGANSATLTQATLGVPEIAVQSPVGTEIASGGSRAALGSITVGSSADFTFRVVNSGSAALSVSGISFGGANSADFSVVGGSTANIAAGGSQDFTIRFAPAAAGARSGTVTFANNDSDEGTYVINLSGTGSAAATAPVVTTSTANPVGVATATLNGNVNSDGGAAVTERGFVYSTTATTPTIGAGGVTKVTVSGTTGAMTQGLTGLAANQIHYFRAYAINSVGTTYGAVQNFTTLKAEPAAHVTNFAAGAITTANIPLTWAAASPQPDGYLIRVSSTTVTDPTDGTPVADSTNVSGGTGAINLAGSATSYSGFTGFAAGTTYTFKIFPYNNSGASIDYRTAATVPTVTGLLLPAAPATPTFASVTSTGFTVNWGAVSGAASYRLDISTASNFGTFVSGYSNLTVNGTSQAVSGLAPNTIYYARVRAVNATGTGASSTAGSQTTSQLSAPTTLAASAVTSSGFTANWNAVAGATGYRVDVTVLAQATATDLFFSEYVEGSSNNKYIEIYNGTGSTVDLSDYEVRLFVNGASTASPSQDLSALTGGPSTLAPGGTLILKNSSAALSLPAGVTAYNSGVANYNGDDALGLWKKSTSAYVDIFGRIGDDPGTAWTSGSLTTLDKTLRRKTSVTGGVTTNPTGTGAGAFTALGTEWDQYDIDAASGLGSHALDSTTTFLAGYQNADAGNNTSLVVTGCLPSTEYTYVVRATSANSTSPNSDARTVTTSAATPVLNSVTLGSALSTTYGTPSSGVSFTASGSHLTGNITVTAQTGFEVSTSSGSGYGGSVAVGSGTTVYVRFAAARAAGTHNGATAAVLSSAGASNANVTTSGSGNNVAQKTLTITGITAQNKVYDGTNTASVTGTAAYSGLENGESFAVSGSVTWTFADKHVGTSKPLTRTGSYNAPSANYTVTQPAFSANITARPLTITAQANTKVYDGNTSSATNAAITAGAIQPGDTAPTWTQTYSTKNVGTSMALTPSSAAKVNDGNSGNNYSYTYTPANVGAITARPLTITAQANTKVYDGNTSSATNAAITVGAIQPGDTTPAWTQTYDNANAGSGKTLTPSSSVKVNDGNSGNNYTYFYVAQAVGVINKANQAVVDAELNPDTITYGETATVNAFGGSTDGAFEFRQNGGSGSVNFVETGSGEERIIVPVTVGTAAIEVRRLGDVNYNDGAWADAGTLTIQPKALTITANDVNKQVGEALTGGAGSTAFTSSGLVGTETIGSVTITYGAAAGAGASAGTYANQVTPSAATGGTFNPANYSITYVSGAINVSAAPVPTIATNGAPSALSTTYGTASSSTSFGVSGYNLTGGITVTAPTGYEVALASGITTNGFDQGSNYSGAGSITAGANAGSGFAAWSTTYTAGSGSAGTFIGNPASAGIAGMSASSIGFYANPLGSGANAELQRNFSSALAIGQTFSFQWGLNFDSNTNNSNRGFSLFGSGPTELININMANSATLTINGSPMFTQYGTNAMTIGITRTGENTLRVFGTGRNGTAAFEEVFTVASAPAGFKFYFNATVGGDNHQMYVNNLALTTGQGAGTFSTSVVISGTGNIYSTTVHLRLATNAPAGTINGFVGLTSDGATPLNVALPQSTVNPKGLTITGVTAANKVYDRTTAATLSGTAAYEGLVNGESFVNVLGTQVANFDTAAVGNGKAVTVTGYLPPTDNYTVSQPSLTANITPAMLTVSGATAANKVYDRTTAATLSNGGSLVGVFSGDTVTLGNNSTGTFANATVGNSKSVTTFMTIGGGDAGNYTLTQPTITANITAKELTVTGASVTAKTYDGNTSATISGATLSGVISPDVVTLGNSTTGTFLTASAGTKSVTPAMTISGADASNYFLTQPTLSGTINTKALTVTANNVTKNFGDTLTGGAGSTAFTSSGLVSGETIGSVTIAYGAAGGASAAAGVYAGQVTPSAATGGSFSASNYNINYVAGSITVNAIAPNLVTLPAESIGATTVAFKGELTSDGGSELTEIGILYSATQQEPVPGAGVIEISEEPGGPGIYTFDGTGLSPGQTYYFRFFARRNADIFYGNVRSFTNLCFTNVVAGLMVEATNDTSFTLLWNTLPGASGYALDVSTNSAFATRDPGTPGHESFDNLDASGSAYSDGSFSGDDGLVWNYTGARKVTSTDNITGTSIGFGTSGSRTTGASGPDGIRSLTYSVRSYFTGGTASDRSIEVYVGGELRDSYTLEAMATVYTRTISDLNITGIVPIEFRSTGSRQIVLDDVRWTGYGALTPSLIPGYSNRAVAGTSAIVTGLTEGVTYYYRVRATNANCVTANSATGSVRTVDVTAPSVTNFLVAGGVSITDAQLTNGVSLSVNFADGSGISNSAATPTFVVRYPNGSLLASNRFTTVPANGTQSGTLSGTFTGTFNNITLGTYTATVHVADTLGNTRATNFTFTVTDDDVEAPVISTLRIGMAGGGGGFVTNFFESMGTSGTAGGSIANHESNDRFDNVAFTMSGTGDMRTTSDSTGAYDGASGGFNVMLNNSGETFELAGIDTTGQTNLALAFGVRKNTSDEDGSGLTVQVSSNGTDWTTLTIPALPVSSATAGWHARTNSAGVIPAASNLRIRFTSSNSVEWRIDDVKLIHPDTSPVLLTDEEIIAGIRLTGTVQDDSGVYGINQTGALAPTVTVFNASGAAVAGSVITNGPANGGGITATGFTNNTAIGAGNLVIGMTYTSRVAFWDYDLDRVNDSTSGVQTIAFTAVDDDTDPPVIGAFGAGGAVVDLTLGSLSITGRLADASGIDFSRTYYLLRNSAGTVLFSNAFASVAGTNVAVSHNITNLTGLTCGQIYTVTVFAADADLDRGVADSLSATGGVFTFSTIGSGTPGDAPVATNLTINGTVAAAATTITDAQLASGSWRLGLGLSHPDGIFTNASSPSIKVTNSTGVAIGSTKLTFTGTSGTTTFFTNNPMPAVSYANVATGLQYVLWSATNTGACVSGIEDRNLISGGTNLFSVVDDDTTGPSFSGFAIAGGVYTVDVSTALSSGITVTGLVSDASGIGFASAPAYALLYRANGTVMASNQFSGANTDSTAAQAVSITLSSIPEFACGNAYTVQVFAADNDNDRANDRTYASSTFVIYGSGTGGEAPLARNLTVKGGAAGSTQINDVEIGAGNWTLGLTLSLSSANIITNGALAPTFNIVRPDGSALFGSEQAWTGITRSGTNYTLTATIPPIAYAAITTGTHTVRWSARGEGLCFGAAAQSMTIAGGNSFTVSDDDVQPPVIISFNAAGGAIDDCVNASPCPDLTRTNLAAGDIAIFAMNAISAFGGSQNKDAFAFAALVDIPAGTEIKFTDNGWRSSDNTFRSQEGVLIWRATSCVQAGTVVRWTATNSPVFNIGELAGSEGNFGLNTTAEQILAYQGPNNAPNFIYAIHQPTIAGTWDAPPGATSSRTSARPPGLVDGVTAVIVPDFDNVIINTNTLAVSGTRNQVLNYIGNPANWVGANQEFYDIASYSFTFPGLCFTGGTITDGDVRTGGWTIEGLVEDIASGISTSGLSYEIINTAGGVINSNLLSATFTNGARTVAFTNSIGAAASTNLITLGTYTSRIHVADADNDRPNDSAAVSTNVPFNVVDDDTDPPQLRNFTFNGKTVITDPAEMASLVITGEVRDVESGIAFASEPPSYEVRNSAGTILASGVFNHGNRTNGDATNWVSITAGPIDLSMISACGVYTMRVTVADADFDRADDQLITVLPFEFAFAPGSDEAPVASGLLVNGQPAASANLVDGGLIALSVSLNISHPFGIVNDEDIVPFITVTGPTGTVFTGGTVSSLNATTVTINASWNIDYYTRQVGEFAVTWTAQSPGVCFGAGVNATNITGGHTFTIVDDDTTPPAAITNFISMAANWSNNKAVNFVWSEVSDASGIYEYRFATGAQPSGAGAGVSLGVTNRVVITNLLEGISTNWIFAVDNDNDRENDRLAGPATSAVSKLDFTPPAGVLNVLAANDLQDVEDTSSEVLLSWTVTANSEAQAAGPRVSDGAALSPFKSYRIYYTENDALAEWPTTNSLYLDVLDGFASLSDYSATNVLLTGLTPGTEYRLAIAGVDEAGNIGPLTNAQAMVRTTMFDINHAFVNESNGVVIEWSGPAALDYDVIYAEGVGFAATINSAWQLAATVQGNRFVDTGDLSSGRAAPAALSNGTMRFYRVAPVNAWVPSDDRDGIASSNVVAVAVRNLQAGNNIIGFPVTPFSNTMASVFGLTRLPAGSPNDSSTFNSTLFVYTNSVYGDSSPVQFSLVQGEGEPNYWRYTANGSDWVDANDRAAPLTNAVSLRLPSATKLLLAGLVRPFDEINLQRSITHGDYNMITLEFPFPVKVREIPGLRQIQAYNNQVMADRIIIINNEVNPPVAKYVLYRRNDDRFMYIGGGSAEDHELMPGEAIAFRAYPTMPNQGARPPLTLDFTPNEQVRARYPDTTTRLTNSLAARPSVNRPGVSVAGHSATISGRINPHGQATAYWIRHGETATDASNSEVFTLPAINNSFQQITYTVHGLEQGRSYFFEVVASNAVGIGRSSVMTPVGCPSITVTNTVLPPMGQDGGGSNYNVQLGATGGEGPYTFEVISGALPQGLTLGANGVISGNGSGAGRTFSLRVTDSRGCSGVWQGTIEDESTNAITLTANPATICSGGSSTLTLSGQAAGATLQWQKSLNGGVTYTAFSASGSSYVAAGITTSIYYRVLVTSQGVASTSTVAIVSVTAPPVITIQPKSVTVPAGAITNFTVVATGANLGYQWQSSTNNGMTWANVGSGGSGGNTPVFTTQPLNSNFNGRQLRVIVSNACHSVTSTPAVITVEGAQTGSTAKPGAFIKKIVKLWPAQPPVLSSIRHLRWIWPPGRFYGSTTHDDLLNKENA